MPKLIDRATGVAYHFPDSLVAGALASGKYDAPEGLEIQATLEGDLPASVRAEDAALLGARGDIRGASAGEIGAREEAARIEREHGGVVGSIGTAAESALDSATLGLYGLAADAAMGDEYARNRRERALANEAVAIGSSIVGSVLPSLLSGGAGAAGAVARLTPAGAAARLGSGIAVRGAGRGFVGSAGYRALGYGAEGALVGAGSGLSELTLSEDPVTFERAASLLSDRALLGGITGAGASVFATAAEKGISKARRLVSEASAKASKAAAVSDDLSRLDKEGLREARTATQATEGAAIADDVARYYAAEDAGDAFLIAAGQQRKILSDTNRRLRRQLDAPKQLARRPSSLLDPLEREEKALREILDGRDDLLATLAKEDETLIAQIDELEAPILKGKVATKFADYSGRKVTAKAARAGIDVTPEELLQFRQALAAGEVRGARARALDTIGARLEANQALQRRVTDLLEGNTPRLKEIGLAEDALTEGGKKGFLEQTAQGALFSTAMGVASPLVGPAIGAMAAAKVSGKLTDLVFGRMARASADAAQRTARAVDAFLDLGGKAARVAPPLASKVLASASFGGDEEDKSKSLAAAFERREKELRGLTASGPDGSAMLTPRARRQLAANLDGVRALSPIVADRMEAHVAQRVSYLASQLPKRPDYGVQGTVKDRWRPSEMQLRSYARREAAAADPGAVEERVAAGMVTPEDAETYRALYPERHADFVRQIIERLPTLQKSLPYRRRLALSIFTGVPVDPAMDPRVLRVLQSHFVAEEGTSGGMEPPKAQPQFGSVTKPEHTPAQERAG